MAKRREGRPPKDGPPVEKTTAVMRFRVTEAERAEIMAGAEAAGLEFSPWAVEQLRKAAKRALARKPAAD